MPDISSSLSKREVNARQNTYTKSEIDLKDGAIQAIAEAAQTTADAAEKKNQEQDQLIAELQKSSHSHSNQDVLDKTEQPYTTAERDKLAGLENYTHPTHTAHKKEFYKFASDGEGHVTDAEKVTASDLYNAGGVIQSALNLYDYRGYIPLSFMTLYYGGGLKNIAEILFLDRDSNKQREIRLCLGSYNDRSTGCLNLVDYNGCQYILEPNPDSPGTQAYIFYFPKQSGTIALTKDIPDISGKQDKSTAVTHTANTAVGSTAKPVYIAGDGKATPITHSINSDVPANAKFTDTTYSDVTETTHGLMTAEDKKKLNGLEASKFMNLNNSAIVIHGAGGTAQWYRLGTLVSSGNFNTAIIRILSGDGANGYARQNSSFEIHIKDAWQSTETASAKACGVTVYRINCANVKVKVIPTAHNTYTVWVYLPWGYWNGDYAVYGKYASWTTARLVQPDEPDGTVSETAYYDCAFLDSTVAAAKTLTDSGWVAMTVEGYAKSGTVKYRTYGKQITITGSVVLKNDIATSYPAPQYIASTTFDFSKIVGCSGVGRSSSGVGAYVAVENYNGDNLVCVYALGSKIAAGSTLYFTITGFID